MQFHNKLYLSVEGPIRSRFLVSAWSPTGEIRNPYGPLYVLRSFPMRLGPFHCNSTVVDNA